MKTLKKAGLLVCGIGMTLLPFIFGYVIDQADQFQDSDGLVLWLVAIWIVCVLGLISILGKTEVDSH